MQNNRGQALVEFVLILPIIMMVICVVIDFSTIFYNKNHLEGVLNDSVDYISRGHDVNKINSIINDKEIKYSSNIKNNMLTITLRKNIKLVTPFSKVFFDDPYTIKTERTILNE